MDNKSILVRSYCLFSNPSITVLILRGQYFFHRFGEQSVVLPMRQTGYRDDSGHLPFLDDRKAATVRASRQLLITI